jgi:hypothetical protein
MTATATTNDKEQIGKQQRHYQKRRPLTLPSPARGEGKTTATTTTTATAKALSVSGLPRADKAALAIDGKNKVENGNGIIRNGDPSPYPLPQGARERPRPRQIGKRQTAFKNPVSFADTPF